MNKKILFSLDNIEEVNSEEDNLYEAVKKSRFAKVKIRLFGTGDNAHTEPVDFETLKRSADSAYDIPLIAELNPYRGNADFGGHGTLTGKQFSFGFIKESKENPIMFEQDEVTGKTFITLYALIWKKYFKNIVDILVNNDSKTEVSVELEELGNNVSERGKPILHQFVLNAVTFLGKVTSAACKGAMAQLCFSEDSECFNKDKKHYFENMEQSTVARKEEAMQETEEKKNEIQEEVDQKEDEKMEEEVEEGCEDKEVKESCEDKQEEPEEKMEDSEDKEDEDDKEDEEKSEIKEEDSEQKEEEMQSEEKMQSFEDMQKEIDELKEQNQLYQTQIASMSDYQELKTFKEETIEKENRIAEMAQMNAIMDSLKDKGVKMSEEIQQQMIESRKDFANINAWSNYVKAYAFDNCEVSNDNDGIVKMDIVKPQANHTEEFSGNVWEQLKNKFEN